jgi:uncharacterized cupin superfamily protein
MGIQVIQSAVSATALTAVGDVPAPLTQPAAQVSGLDVTIPGRPELSTGLWECTPGRFRRQLKDAEVMHILAGAGKFTTTEGKVFEFKAGDTLFFPPETTGEWEIVETVRKVYVLV